MAFLADRSERCAGDAIIGDQDGVVVVPAAVAQEVYDIAHSREVIEGIIKEQVGSDCETSSCDPDMQGARKCAPASEDACALAALVGVDLKKRSTKKRSDAPCTLHPGAIPC